MKYFNRHKHIRILFSIYYRLKILARHKSLFFLGT
uniref:Uncharacterized protein n=1 Tax=Anguilla anguilla TaxID=7936 RepID=A0A0E9T6K9_ANGAN